MDIVGEKWREIAKFIKFEIVDIPSEKLTITLDLPKIMGSIKTYAEAQDERQRGD